MQQCFLGINVAMSFNRLLLEYALEGRSNYIAWKDRMEVVLDDNGLKEFVEVEVRKPTYTVQVDAWQKKTAKCQSILLEGMKDHIVSSLHGKASPYLMWKALTDLFQRKSDQRKLALKDKLRNIKCEKGDSMPKYLTKFTQCRDELGCVGVTVDDEDLVSLALLVLWGKMPMQDDPIHLRCDSALATNEYNYYGFFLYEM